MKRAILFLFCIASLQQVCLAQQPFDQMQINTITAAVPFLQIESNAQAYGFGAIGVVASDMYTDNGFNQNPAHLARGRTIAGGRFNYVPWLRKLVPDVNLYELDVYYSYNDKNIWAVSARLFRNADITFTAPGGGIIGTFRPTEYYAGARYAHYFSEYFSVGGALKYINAVEYSNIITITNSHAVAGDIGLDFRRHYRLNEETRLHWNIGVSVLNVGNKMNYGATVGKQFLPASLKLGTMVTIGFKQSEDSYIALDIGYQCEKLLVPTPPLYKRDSTGNYIQTTNGDYIIDKGYNPNVSMARGLYQSFYDAPGGAREEGQEFIHQFGTEVRMVDKGGKLLYALRGGFFYENKNKGNRQFFTAGIGFGYCGFFTDIAYIIPTAQRHPLENTVILNIGLRTNLFTDAFRFKERI